MRAPRGLLGLAALGALGLAAGLLLHAEPRAPAPTPANGGVTASQPAPAAAPPRVRSLRGTDVDGRLRADSAGHLVRDPDTLALFDYYLAATGEEPLAVIRARIEAHIDALGEPAAGEAEALLDSYLRFRTALRELAEADEVPEELERRWQWLRELRREHFGSADAEALFGREEDVVRVDLARRRVAQDASLSAAEREARLEALAESLPPEVRETRQRTRAAAAGHREVEALRDAGASDAEVFALREQHFGAAAAERLAALDAERARFAARLSIYRAERAALLEAGEAREGAIEALRASHFSGPELLRVRALDELHATTPPGGAPGAGGDRG